MTIKCSFKCNIRLISFILPHSEIRDITAIHKDTLATHYKFQLAYYILHKLIAIQ